MPENPHEFRFNVSLFCYCRYWRCPPSRSEHWEQFRPKGEFAPSAEVCESASPGRSGRSNFDQRENLRRSRRSGGARAGAVVVRRAGRSSWSNFDQRENLHQLRRSARAHLQVVAVGAVSTKGRSCGGRGGLEVCGRVRWWCVGGVAALGAISTKGRICTRCGGWRGCGCGWRGVDLDV